MEDFDENDYNDVSLFFNPNAEVTKEQTQQARDKEFLNIKNKRRSKKDKTGRNFVCGCGKEYLSYPALYTHIKTKHGGTQPDGTKAHHAGTGKTRGRPKKVDTRADENRTIPDRDNAPFSLTFLHQPSLYKGEGTTLLDNFVEKSDLRLVGEFNLEGYTDPTVGFPIMSYYDNDKPTYHPFHVIISTLQSDRSETILSNNSCDTVMALFLFSASKIINEKFYLVLGVFFRNLRECLNEQGYEIIAHYFVKNYSEEARSLIPRKKENKTFCEVESPEYLPLVSDRFILQYLPKYCPEFDQQLAVDIMFDFCKWLIKKKFARIKISFNDDEECNMKEEEEEGDSLEYDDYDVKVSKKLFGEVV